MKKELLADWCQDKDNNIISKEWDFTKNQDIDFYTVSSKAAIYVWWRCSKCGFEWKARIGNRTSNGSGCPACANKIVWKGHNDLETINPELSKEWDYTKNNDIYPSDYVPGSRQSVWWRCSKCGGSWKAAIYTRSNGIGCPFCSGHDVRAGLNDLESNRPSLAKEWDYTKNDGLTPSRVTTHSGKIVWWKCSTCGFNWRAEIKARSAGTGCPVCANKYLWKGHNDLATKMPELIKEWNYKKNDGISPDEYLVGSHKVVWWTCATCGNEWEASIKTRCEGTGCAKCGIKKAKITLAERRFDNQNTLGMKYPDLIKEWDFSKNTIDPLNVAPFSGEKVWWKCSVCGYEWKSAISSRTRGVACPVCSNKKVWIGHNDLATTHPELAKEWDYEKNGIMLPSNYTVGSGVSVWWKCQKCGNEWESPINNRKGKPCPKCNSMVGTSEPEQFVYYYMKKLFDRTINRYRAKWLNPFVEIDIFIPELNLAIEYDGQNWHTDVKRDLEKSMKIREHGLQLIRVREENCPLINDDSYIVSVKSGDDASLSRGIYRIIEYINLRYSLSLSQSVNFDRDRLDVLSLYKRNTGQQSLFYSGNPIVDEWDYEKNGELTPKDFSCNSHAKVWWKCATCGYQYESMISTRIRSTKGVCPLCCGRIVIKGKNDFASQRPELLAEWDYEKNGTLLPTAVTSQSGKKVWWKCPICGKSWMAAIHDRKKPCHHIRSK